jgi:hypothetical protein
MAPRFWIEGPAYNVKSGRGFLIKSNFTVGSDEPCAIDRRRKVTWVVVDDYPWLSLQISASQEGQDFPVTDAGVRSKIDPQDRGYADDLLCNVSKEELSNGGD